MTRNGIRLFWSFWIILTFLWLVTNLTGMDMSGIFAIRPAFMQLTGVLAIGAMSVAMLLAIRPRRAEPIFGGLDKMYRLHKWLGIGALILSVAHWLWANAPKWAVGYGWLARPERGPRPEFTDPLRAWLSDMRHTAESLGEWAFYAGVALILIALITRIPYHLFRWSHRLLAVVYLVLVFHSVILLDFSQWLTPVGVVMACLMLGGSWAALLSIFGRIGASRRVTGVLVGKQLYPGVHSLEKVIKLGAGWPGHKAGQFAFVTSKPFEGAHPYSIASAWDAQDRQVTFIAKELGDYTTGLAKRLEIGQPVTVEGPYGCFTFDTDRPRQIWIGAGIGITPFVARMRELATRDPNLARPEIDLFHASREVDDNALARLRADAHAAGIRVHVVLEERDGFLTGAKIRETVPNWREADLWFCGPTGFGSALKNDFAAHGFPVHERFHQELFQMR